MSLLVVLGFIRGLKRINFIRDFGLVKIVLAIVIVGTCFAVLMINGAWGGMANAVFNVLSGENFEADYDDETNAAGLTVVAASTNTGNSFAITGDGVLWGWGSNRHGQLGDGTMVAISTPVEILSNVRAVSAGEGHTMVIRDDGSLWTWGRNQWGQLGDGTTTDSNVPVKIMDSVVQISASWLRSMALREDGSLWGWGWGIWERPTDGTARPRLQNNPIMIMDDVIYMSYGRNHTMVIRTDGSLWGWGANGNGQLGDGTTITPYIPIRIRDDVIAVAAGDSQTFAIMSDNSLWVWGRGGTYPARIHPTHIMDDVISVSASSGAGFNHVVAIRSDGSLYAWGSNLAGQLGISYGYQENWGVEPTRVMESVVDVATGFASTVVIRADGSLWAFGAALNEMWNIIENRHTPVQLLQHVMTV